MTNVTAAVMVLMAPGGRIPKDRSWKAAKVMMAKVDTFLDALIHFNKENIPEACLKAIQPYLQVSFLPANKMLELYNLPHYDIQWVRYKVSLCRRYQI